MIDLRLWRAALLAVLLALVVAMFSLEEVPKPLASGLPPDAFDPDAAGSLAKELADSSAEPQPGSEQDAAVAEVVESRFTAIPSASISEQLFKANFEGEEVELRNLIASLPGQSDRQVALIAQRDSARGTGAGSGLAATAALLEIANGFSGSTHRKTLVFVSTDGGSIGAAGARRFIRDYSDAGQLDAAVVLSQPAAADLSPPLVIPWSTGPQSGGAQLTQTAIEMVSAETGGPAGDPGPLGDLFRLALPSALGEQGPLVESGLDAVRLSSSGELPLPPDRDDADAIDEETIDRFGRAALSLILALDGAPAPEHGPKAYIGLSGNLLPGWTLSLLALALLAAVAATALVGLGRMARSPLQAAASLGWVLLRAVPFAAALALVYVFAFFGLIPSPEFPFDPAWERLGLGGTIGVAAALIGGGIAAFLLRPLLPPSPGIAAVAPASALALAALAGFGVWWVNPYLGLLVAIGLQLWVPAAAGVGRRRLGTAGLLLAGLVPVLAAVADLAGRFDAGLGVVSDLLLMFTGGQLSDRLAVLSCLLAGAALALIATSGPAPGSGTPQMKLRTLVARGRALEERRSARKMRRGRGKRRRDAERPADREPDASAPGEPPPDQAESAESPEPARDPRMWSKPRASILRPASSLTAPRSPSPTSPIEVSR